MVTKFQVSEWFQSGSKVVPGWFQDGFRIVSELLCNNEHGT